MTIYQKNLNVIQDKYPELFTQLKEVKNEWSMVPSRSGTMTIHKGRDYLHSRYDPLKEAKQFIDREEIVSDKTWIVCGLGLGYHLFELVSRLPRYNLLVVIEPDIDVFNEAIKILDFTEIFQNPRNIFYIGKSSADVYESLTANSFSFVAAGFSIIEWKVSIKLEEEYFLGIADKLNDAIRMGLTNIRTTQHCGRRMIANTLNNLPSIIESPGVVELMDAAKGYAGIIVSAGPSLNKNIQDLKEAKGKMFIVSTDTALRILLQNGIEPDFVVTMDYNAQSERHFINLDSQNIPLIFDAEAAHESLLAYKGPLISSLTQRPLVMWVGSIFANKGILNKGLSVAHTVFDLLKLMGCSTIIFIGQDLSFPGGKTHAAGTHSQMDVSEKHKDYFWVKNERTGEKLLTRNDMYIYLRIFEQMVQETEVHCVNATEGGLGIRGTEWMTLKDAIIKYGNTQLSTGSIIEQLNLEKVKYDTINVTEKIQKLADDFLEMKNSANNIMGALEKLIDSVKVKPELDRREISKVVAETQLDAKVIRSKKICLELIHSEFLVELMQMQREGELSAEDAQKYSKQEMIDSLTQDLRFQKIVADASEFIGDHLKLAIEELKARSDE